MVHYKKNGYDISTVIRVTDNDTNGSKTGYKGFPLSYSEPSNYTYTKIPGNLGYKLNGVDLADIQSLVNATFYSFYTNSNNTNLNTNLDVSNYNYMSGTLIGGGGGGGKGGGSGYGACGGGGGGGGGFYRVNISNENIVNITVGGGGTAGQNFNDYGNSGGDSIVALGTNNANDRVVANGGSGGGSANNRTNGGGPAGTFEANGNFIGNTNNNFSPSNKGGSNPDHNDRAASGGNVGDWNIPLATYVSGNGGAGGDSGNSGNGGDPGNSYGGGGGGGAGTNRDDNWNKGGEGHRGYVDIWLYKE